MSRQTAPTRKHGNSRCFHDYPVKRARTQPPPARSTHNMTTRKRAKIFPFLELPGELRNRIYEYVLQDGEDIALQDVKLPPFLKISRQVFIEATPIFFDINTFTHTIRSNWCVRSAHLHDECHLHYKHTGRLDLPVDCLLSCGKAMGRLAHFCNVTFRIDCCCCVEGIQIANAKFGNSRGLPTVNVQVTRRMEDVETTNAIIKMFAAAKCRLGIVIAEQKKFRGWTIQDLHVMASCFRTSPEPKREMSKVAAG